MSASAFATLTLPETLPIFPLSGVVLLPRARLPLHIFEPRYIAMFDDALRTQHRLIGIIQPCTETGCKGSEHPAIYSVGCVGRIASFSETEDGRYMVSLTGISRFEVAEELPLDNPYRQVRANWNRFPTDRDFHINIPIDHERLGAAVQPYFKAQKIEADWAAIEALGAELMVSMLAMICPFAPNEKQALLEAPTLAVRAEMLIALLEMAALPPVEGSVN